MDDIIYTLSAMRATGCRIRIRTIDIPTLSGPTSGTDMVNEFKEFWVQSERWTIGAAEVFHYFFVKLIKCNYFLPGLAYVSLLMCLLLFIMTRKHHFFSCN
jgi:cellulose synthase/poly-beta-1,6-N-acetylglucosamine synthase-like glycosyltransferase